jgi:hypothetical protein
MNLHFVNVTLWRPNNTSVTRLKSSDIFISNYKAYLHAMRYLNFCSVGILYVYI